MTGQDDCINEGKYCKLTIEWDGVEGLIHDDNTQSKPEAIRKNRRARKRHAIVVRSPAKCGSDCVALLQALGLGWLIRLRSPTKSTIPPKSAKSHQNPILRKYF
jgi:hypothetical protein